MSEREHDALLDHSYDGIQEYDNPMPMWWKAIFLGSFVFSVFYIAWYHGGGPGKLVIEEYEAEMAEFNAQEAERAMAMAVDEDSLRVLMADKNLMTQADGVYKTRCAVCHGQKGEGLIGPNLTDDHWIHGATLMNIWKSVDEGYADKGMPAWGRQLRPEELRSVVAYVGTLRGKNIPGKEPQGDKVDMNALSGTQ
jgi:cytochrome c oxidase cbb3-type subunit 3